MYWSDKDDKLLISLWQAGKKGHEIAEVFKVKRGAVLGRIHRLRLNGVEIRKRPIGTQKPCAPRKAKPIQQPKKFEPVNPNHEAYKDPCDIMGLRYFSCRYVVSEKPTLYCNQLIHKHSYCEYHFQLCYQVGTNVPLTAKPRPSIKYPKG